MDLATSFKKRKQRLLLYKQTICEDLDFHVVISSISPCQLCKKCSSEGTFNGSRIEFIERLFCIFINFFIITADNSGK